MGNKDGDYDILYRGETRDYIPPGRVMFIQRAKECGGGYWLGKAYDDAFIFELEHPVSLSQGIDYIMFMKRVAKHVDDFDDDFTLT
ncbi:hypothetical protein [Serratia fonticola]|uniref:hypothetical protein n=1 Tax=Serratia fonticola TaxID=47917 RepID=UPI0013768313|nr:hypothetical protein [Serratia fonticola]NCG52944.1 hypothetical protein [Serratia fonticola]